MPETIAPQKRRTDEGVKSLVKVITLLDCFSTADRTLSLGELCRRARLPKSTTHRLVASMREVGLLDQDRDRDSYRLGLKLFELGNTVLANMDLHREARPFVESLARLSGQVVHLAVFDGRQAVVVHSGNPHPEGSAPAYVEVAPVHCTSVGKAILAHQPGPVIERIIAGGLARFTEGTITEPDALRREIEVIRARGYAVDEAEHQPGLRCVGAPIRDVTGRAFAAVSVSGPAWRIPVGEVPGMAKLVIHSAQAISAALGYRPPLS